jgi:uncharacterized RDD family membrane protein YckC
MDVVREGNEQASAFITRIAMTMTATDRYIDRVLDRLPRTTPQRQQIATELRGHIAERTAGGQPEQEVLRQLGDPGALAESYLAAVPLVPVFFGKRVVAKVIDAVAVIAVVVPLALVGWRALPPEVAPFVLLAGLVSASFVFAFYTLAAEVLYGRTFGKALLDLRVVRESGARIGVGQAIVRQLPMFLQVYMIDALFALFTEKHQRAFELLSKTRVVSGRV